MTIEEFREMVKMSNKEYKKWLAHKYATDLKFKEQEERLIAHQCAIDPEFKKFWYEEQGKELEGENYEIVKYGIGGMAPQFILI